MGLDIYKRAVSKEKTDLEIILDFNETNKSKIALFKKFAHLVETKNGEYIDYDATFEKLGCKFEDYDWTSTTSYGEFEISKYINIETNDVINLCSTEYVTFFRDYQVLYFTEIGYERKMMNTDFYTKVLAGCWYVSENTLLSEDASMDYVIDNDSLNNIKKYCQHGSNVLSWTLNDDEFIYFCY